jgi:hypothetical protein
MTLIVETTGYYDPSTGRFTVEDQVGFGGGDSNLYRYVGNSPTNAIDPFGLDPILLPTSETQLLTQSSVARRSITVPICGCGVLTANTVAISSVGGPSAADAANFAFASIVEDEVAEYVTQSAVDIALGGNGTPEDPGVHQETRTPSTVTESNARVIYYGTDPFKTGSGRGYLVRVPPGYLPRPSRNGTIFQPPGTRHPNGCTIRIGQPRFGGRYPYPEGYGRYTDPHGRYIDPRTGLNSGNGDNTHIGFGDGGYQGPLLAYPE